MYAHILVAFVKIWNKKKGKHFYSSKEGRLMSSNIKEDKIKDKTIQ